MADSEARVQLDLRGLKCPLPVLRARKAAKGMRPGQILEVLATDPRALNDFPAFCENDGHELLSATEQQDGVLHIALRVAGS